MHDIKFIRKNPDKFDEGLVQRGLEPLSAKILDLDNLHRDRNTELQKLQTKRNEISKSIADNKRIIINELIGPWGRII